MEVDIKDKESFKVIGLEGKGSAKTGHEWVPKLWDRVFDRLNEISDLIKTERTSEAWGLMSALDDYLQPWKEEGKYLAGFEFEGEVDPPNGWSVWKVPQQKYAVVGCKMETYIDAFQYVMKEFIPENGYKLSGAVHEFYPEEFEDIEEDILYLYIPIENI